MLVQDWMSKHVITIGPTDNMQHAIDLMMDHHISMLPVTVRGKLIGIVTDRESEERRAFRRGCSGSHENPVPPRESRNAGHHER